MDDRHNFWEKWGNMATVVAVIGGFLGSGALYMKQEGKRDQQIEYIVAQIADFGSNRYTKEDAQKDQALNSAHFTDLSDRMKQLEWRANSAQQPRQPYPVIQPSPMPKRVP